MNSNHSKSNILIKFEKYCYCKLNKNYNVTSITLNKLIISNIIYNNRLHIVSCFKEFLIFYDPGDFLSAFYKRKEARHKIKEYSEFYTLNSRIFPNYILLPESQYIFNNIKKKQKLLDHLEEINNKYYNENSQNLIMNYSDVNNYNRSLQLNRTQSSYFSTIFTPSIVNSILNERDSMNKYEDNTSNVSNINFIIDNINKNQKNKRNLLLYKTPKNKIIKSNASDNMKNSVSSVELFLNDKNNNLNNSIMKTKGKNNIINKYNINYNKEKEKEKNKNKNSKDKLSYNEFSNDKCKKSIKNSRQQNAPKKIKNNNIHKKTQSNENIRNDINVFQDNETINNKISMLLKTNFEIKSVKNNIYSENNTNAIKNKKGNNNLQRYIQHITKISKGTKKNNITINKSSVKNNNKMSLKKVTNSKTNTTYTNKTQSQPSISYHHKKVTAITKSMPKLSTYFDNNIKKNQYPKNNLHNQLFNFPSGYHSLKNNNINSNSYYYNSRKSKNKISNRKSSHKITKNIKDKSLNNFYQIVQKNIDNNIKYNISNMKNNYVSTGKPKIAHANKNKNKKNSLIPSLHISLGTIMNNNNTFIIVGNQSLSKSKSKSRSKSKSINKSNSIIKILDDNNKHKLYISKKNDNINKIKLNMNKQIHKTHDGLQTERIKNSNNLKTNKVNNIPKITFDVNINNNNIKKQNENKMILNKNKSKDLKNKNDTTENLHINLQGNSNNKNINNRFPQSARNKNNTNNLNNNKNSNFCSEVELQNNQAKPTTHRVFNKFNFQNQNKKKKISDNPKEIISPKNKNIYLIHNYNINNVNDNINFFSQQNLKSTFNKNVLSKRNSMNQEQGTNIIININNNIFQNNKNNFNYNNYIYNSSVNNNNCSSNKKYNIKNLIKSNTNSKNSKNYKKDNK